MIKENCNACGCGYSVFLTGRKKSNGTMETLYSEQKVLRTTRDLCYSCGRKKQELARDKSAGKRYEKTKKGKLVRTYRNMLSRVRGILKKKAHLYKGLDILPKEEFYSWAMSDAEFHRLFKVWEDSDYERALSPSIDRVSPKRGYALGNIRFLTHSENSRRGGLSD